MSVKVKLGKTDRKVLAQVHEHCQHWSCYSYSSHDRRREWNSAKKLVKAGLLEQVGQLEHGRYERRRSEGGNGYYYSSHPYTTLRVRPVVKEEK